MEPAFTIKEALTFGWRKFKENMKFLIIMELCFMIGSLLLDGEDRSGLVMITSILFGCFSSFTSARIGLKIFSGHKLKAEDIVNFEARMFGYYILASLVTALLVFAGLVLLVVPGIIALIRFTMYPYVIIKDNLGPIDSIRRSADITKGYFWPLLGFFLTLFIVNILGLIFFFIGFLVTLPVTSLAVIYVFDKLRTAKIETPTLESSTPA